MLEEMKYFLNQCKDYLFNNLALGIVLIACFALFLITAIVLIVTAKKRSKKRIACQLQEQKRLEEEKLTREKAKAEEQKRLEEEKLAREKAKAEEQKRLEEEKLAREKAKAEEEVATADLFKTLEDSKKITEEDFDEEDDLEQSAKYSGKWMIYRVVTDKEEDEEMYFFELRASNGEKLLSSEEYTTYNGALRGIQTHKTNILKDNFKITLSKKGDYIFKLLSGKNMLLCMGENYSTKARCEKAIESTKRFAKTAIIDENVREHLIRVPVEDNVELAPLPDGYNGKWLISSKEDVNGELVYYFELFANNGEKLLSSEEYTTYIGAVNGIATHKTNIEKNNFRISLTKRGDYIYKLLNGNGQLLCLGEHYRNQRLCKNAVESVRRFAMNSPVLTDSTLKK